MRGLEAVGGPVRLACEIAAIGLGDPDPVARAFEPEATGDLDEATGGGEPGKLELVLAAIDRKSVLATVDVKKDGPTECRVEMPER